VSEQRNILHEIIKRKANWIGHILRRNCLLKQVIEGKIKGPIEVTRRRGRRRKNLLDDLGDRRGFSHLKEEALDRIKWRNRFGRGCGPVWQITDEWTAINTFLLITFKLRCYKLFPSAHDHAIFKKHVVHCTSTIYYFFNLGSRSGWVVKTTLQSLYVRQRDPVPIV
jgi:hypothetical protein